MNYFLLCRHINELKQALSDCPSVIRAVKLNGRAFAFILKRQVKSFLVFSLDVPEQGLWLSNAADETDMPSLFVKTANRLLTNAHIAAVGMFSAQPFNRVIKLKLISINSYFGNRTEFYIICEFTGRVSNIYICDSDLKIIESFGYSPNNAVGSLYRPLKAQTCQDAFEMGELELNRVLSFSPTEWANYIGGLSNVFVNEAVLRLNGQSNKQAAFLELYRALKADCGKVYAWACRGKIKTLSSFLITQSGYELKAEFALVNDAAEWLYNTVCAPRSFNELKQRCLAVLRGELKKKEELLLKQEELLKSYKGCGRYLHIGQLLTANLYRVKPGDKSIKVVDWQTKESLVIELNPLKSASSQAEKYFVLYKKAFRGIKLVEGRIEELKNDAAALKEQVYLTGAAESASDLQTDLLCPRQKKQKENKRSLPKRVKAHFTPFLELGDCRYYVGKNAKQNDLLTFQFAKKGDIWFHANDVPGSHVVLKKLSGEITQEDLLNGALLAAHFSFLKESGKAFVDYTDIAFVKRIRGSGLGRVNYTGQRTLVVNPQNAKTLLNKTG